MFITPGQLFGGGRQRQFSVHEDFLLSGKTAVLQFHLEATGVTSVILMDLDIAFCFANRDQIYIYIYIHIYIYIYIYIYNYVIVYIYILCILSQNEIQLSTSPLYTLTNWGC